MFVFVLRVDGGGVAVDGVHEVDKVEPRIARGAEGRLHHSLEGVRAEEDGERGVGGWFFCCGKGEKRCFFTMNFI